METIRPLLQTLTHRIPPPLQDLGIHLIGPTCYQSILLNIDLSDTYCLKLGLSKAIGLAIVLASSVVKVPQIIKLVSSRSADGISFLAYLLETTAFLVGLMYNYRKGFPFSTYGETGLILVQNVVVAGLVLWFSGRKTMMVGFVMGVAMLGWALGGDELVGMDWLQLCQVGAGVLGVASKLPQIWAIWSEGSTGQLSAITVFSFLVGSLSRIFTTLQEVDDKLILYGFVAGFAFNLVLATQMAYYWNAPSKKALGKKPAMIPVTASAKETKKAMTTGSSQQQTPVRRATPSTRRRG